MHARPFRIDSGRSLGHIRGYAYRPGRRTAIWSAAPGNCRLAQPRELIERDRHRPFEHPNMDKRLKTKSLWTRESCIPIGFTEVHGHARRLLLFLGPDVGAALTVAHGEVSGPSAAWLSSFGTPHLVRTSSEEIPVPPRPLSSNDRAPGKGPRRRIPCFRMGSVFA